jgi:hypothetical protein
MRQLGCNKSPHDPRTLRLAKYLDKGRLPAAPREVRYSAAVPDPGMLCNDEIGCCVISAMAHLTMYQSANERLPLPPPSIAEVIATYSAIGGYVPGQPSTDNGCNMLAALKYWRRHGMPIGGALHKIHAFAAVNPHDPQDVASALWLFGGLFVAVELPIAAQDMQAWTGVPTQVSGDWEPGGWGGHCVTIQDIQGGPRGDTFGVCTWGGITPMDTGFLQAYGSEAYVVLSDDWLGPDGRCPAGFDREALAQDLAAL